MAKRNKREESKPELKRAAETHHRYCNLLLPSDRFTPPAEGNSYETINIVMLHHRGRAKGHLNAE